jgi:hypothetical protein
MSSHNQAQGHGQGQMVHQQQQQQQQQQQSMNPYQVPLQMAGHSGEPTIGHFMTNTSPNTDMRLINALESGAAYIEGNPAEDEDIELFYYRFVSLRPN